MALISLVSCLSLFLILLFINKLSFSVSFLFTSIVFVSTHLGHSSAVSYSIFLLGFLCYVLFNKSILLSKFDVLLIGTYCLIVLLVICLSLSNGAKIDLNILKFVQATLILLSLKIALNAKSIFNERKRLNIVLTFLFVHLFFGAIGHLLYGIYDHGLFRISGIVFDSNYFGLVLLSLLYCVIIDSSHFKFKRKFLLYFISILILISGSVTAIISLFLFLFLVKRCPSFLMNHYSFFIISLTLISAYLMSIYYIDALQFNDIENTFLQYKVASVKLRLEPQITALNLLKEQNAFWQGFGSGRNPELTGRALHNGLFQLVFSHGIFYFVIFTSWLSLLLLSYNKAPRKDKLSIYAIFYSLLLSSLMLDPLFLLVFNLVLLFSKGSSDEKYIFNCPNNRQA